MIGSANLHSLVKVLVGDGLVAQSFELVCGSHGEEPFRRGRCRVDRCLRTKQGETKRVFASNFGDDQLWVKEMKSGVGSIKYTTRYLLAASMRDRAPPLGFP